jgi:hypothetical protein
LLGREHGRIERSDDGHGAALEGLMQRDQAWLIGS